MTFSTVALGLAIAVLVAPTSNAGREENCSVRTVVDDVLDMPLRHFMATDDGRCLQLCREVAVDEALRVFKHPDENASASKPTNYQCILRSSFQEKVIGEYAFPDR